MTEERQPFQKKNRSAFSNFLLSKYEMYTGVLAPKSYPYYLTLEPSDKCQLRCPTCVTGIENETRLQAGETVLFRNERQKLTPEFLDQLLEEIGEYLFLITFYNFGEPLLNKDLPDLVRRAKAYGIETDINTNLSLPLSDERIEDLLTSGLDYLFASIDGYSQKTYEVHRVGGDFELIKKNLVRLVEAKRRLGVGPAISYNFLVFSFNEHELEPAQAFCDDLGIQFIKREAFVHNPDWLPSYRKGEEPWLVPDEVSLPAGFNFSKNGKSYAWSPLPDLGESRPPRCSWHYGYAAISSGGFVSPCCAVPDQKNDFGRVVPGETSLHDVWTNDSFRAGRAAFSDQKVDGPQLENVCTRCPVPKFLQHMYSLHDYKVIGQFRDVFGDAEPVLNQAFALFSRSRYGQSIDELCPGGAHNVPANMFGTEDPADIAEFVSFVEANLLSESASL